MLALDTSALIARYLDHPTRDLVTGAMDQDHDWCASALVLAEALAMVDRLAIDPITGGELRRALRDDWGRMAVVPVDQGCLERAAELARLHPLRMIDAIHLAAAARLPMASVDCRALPAGCPARARWLQVSES